jgi:hypothetical protein
MKLTLSGALYHNIRYRLSRLGVVLLVVVFAVYIYLQVSIVLINRQIATQQAVLNQKNAELNQLLSDTTFMKLEATRSLKQSLRQMPWSVHIPKVISIVDALQSLDGGDNSAIQLSDFKVSLESLSLRGTVSNLGLLYYSVPERGFVSLLDRFTQLDFIQQMRVQNYTREQDGTFSFVLQATVIHDDNTKQ